MTLEEAIRHAEEKAKCGGQCGEDHAQLAEWLKELRERRAAELEKRTEEHTETHACDCISRQAAIDFIDAGHLCNPNEPRWSDNEIVNFLKSRPSAQPEIVRCKECKYWKDSDGVYRRGFDAESKCPLNLKKVYEGTFYCGMAERRTDENNNE